MKNKLFLSIGFLAVLHLGGVIANAQFPIKIPKIDSKKPKVEQPKSDEKETVSTTVSARAADGGTSSIRDPEPPSQPMFLKETLDVEAKTEPRFWKIPNKNDNPSWYPRVEFRVFYDGSSRQRYNAEWMNSDGSPWFTEQLDFSEATGLNKVSSPYQSESPYSKATQAVGTYPFRIINTKTGETVFQGKYIVKKMPPVPNDSFAGAFYVDHEWNLPLGYVGVDPDLWSTRLIEPQVHIWFKGNLEAKDLEARLFFDGQQVASTDDGGMINRDGNRGGDCYRYREICEYTLWNFSWDNFVLLREDMGRGGFPKNVIFLNDKPGDYTAKIFHKGTQVREITFTIDKSGHAARTPYAEQIFPTLGVFPVKVLAKPTGAAGWKTQMFYGNPLTGFPLN